MTLLESSSLNSIEGKLVEKEAFWWFDNFYSNQKNEKSISGKHGLVHIFHSFELINLFADFFAFAVLG